MDLFTPEFKRLKARRPLPDFSDVIDVNNIDCTRSQHRIVRINLENPGTTPVCGLKPCGEWNVFRFPDFPGFIIIQNPFKDGYQRYWVHRCLQDFSADKRNSSNLTNLGYFEYHSAWKDFASKQSLSVSKDDPLWKLRWVTLGYHYGWDVKEYSEDRKAEFPADVQCLSQYFSHCLGFGPFRAEAGIVNYYHMDSTLGGHTDHSEVDHTAPLFSFSFGQTCVFLLGGPTKETKPMALYLHSGDVCIMSKKARLAYHAVPKILTPSEPNWVPPCFVIPGSKYPTYQDQDYQQNNGIDQRNNSPLSKCEQDQAEFNCNSHSDDLDNDSGNECDENVQRSSNKCTPANDSFVSEEYASHIDTLNKNIERVILELDWKPFEAFLQSSRINLNLRQVLPPGYGAVEPKMMKYCEMDEC